MIKRFSRQSKSDELEPLGFDDYQLRLGDMMRGERATLGKSLLDVERELRIKAAYVAAIENADPDAFDTPGFIPGYVRSYARYLDMDPDRAFEQFCAESGFANAHGMSAAASSRRPKSDSIRVASNDDPLIATATPFAPANEGVLARVEPGAIGSAMVLVALIGAIGYGGWSVLNEVQRVQFAPVENTPAVLSDLDPLSSATTAQDGEVEDVAGVFQPPQESLDRLYRPQVREVPVMVARDGPISTLNPSEIGTLAEMDTQAAPLETATLDEQVQGPVRPKVLEDMAPGVTLVAVRPAWVRVRSASGNVIFEGIMDTGDSYAVPVTEEPPTLRVGESGAIYMAMNGQHYGPVGPRGSVTSKLALSVDQLTAKYQVADLDADVDLSRYVAALVATDVSETPQD